MRQTGKKTQTNWRLVTGTAALVLAILLVLAALLLAFLRADPSTIGILLAGPPEILCLVAIGVLGKENYDKSAAGMRHFFRLRERNAPTSQLRYYCGLAGCLFNGLPLALYAYVPETMPGGSTKYIILGLADLVFIGSLFFAGGEFWEKFRSLFILGESSSR